MLSFQEQQATKIMKDLVVRGGDFENADGTGGESIFGKNLNGSQIFHHHHKDSTPRFNGENLRPVFGKVIKGMGVVSSIEHQPTDSASARPFNEVCI